MAIFGLCPTQVPAASHLLLAFTVAIAILTSQAQGRVSPVSHLPKWSPREKTTTGPDYLDGEQRIWQRSEHFSNMVIRSNNPGDDCAGSEGQWYCNTNSWQRCAAGKWSVVMQCAQGTICSPSGFTYDFHVQSTENGAGGVVTAGANSRRPMGFGKGFIHWALAWSMLLILILAVV